MGCSIFSVFGKRLYGYDSYRHAQDGIRLFMISDFTRAKAAATTARNHPLCKAIQPFYWEIGNKSGPLAAASIPSGTRTTVEAGSIVQIASASKWIYSAYVIQTGILEMRDIKFLTFRSGYTSFTKCEPDQTVGECAVDGRNGRYTAAHDGLFAYDGGHMQQHAYQVMLLDGMDNVALAAQMRKYLGTDIKLTYSSPQLAGGIRMSASAYARFLRKIIGGQLDIYSFLGSHQVPAFGPNSVNAPIPSDENWHYSLGHWVENDPNVGDGSFSSAGAFGFYPWIDASKTYYGVVSRFNLAGAFESVRAGRVIRKAWLTGVAVV